MRKIALLIFGLVVTCIVALGLVVLFSASQENAIRVFKGDTYHFFRQQLCFVGAGVLVAIALALVDYRFWRKHAWLIWLMIVIILVLLACVFVFPKINGSRRWIRLFAGFRLQPAEFAKLGVVIITAYWMDRISWQVEKFKNGALFPALFIGALIVPVFFEPDYGSVIVMGMVGFLIMFVAGTRIVHMTPFIAIGLAGLAYKVFTTANRMARIAAYFGFNFNVGATVSDKAAENAAYQARMALVAIGNGGIRGSGLGESLQKHYYLPEAHTDFIFAIGAEELGIAFSIVTILLFIAFFALTVYIAMKAADRFGKFLVVGMGFLIFFQAIFNIGMVASAYPTKGMALPFFSYGGTNIVSSFFAVGTILSVGIHSYRERRRQFVSKVLKRA